MVFRLHSGRRRILRYVAIKGLERAGGRVPHRHSDPWSAGFCQLARQRPCLIEFWSRREAAPLNFANPRIVQKIAGDAALAGIVGWAPLIVSSLGAWARLNRWYREEQRYEIVEPT